MNIVKLHSTYIRWQLYRQAINFFKLGKQYRALVVFTLIFVISNMLWGGVALSTVLVDQYNTSSLSDFRETVYETIVGATLFLFIIVASGAVSALVQRNQLEELERLQSLPISYHQLFSMKINDVFLLTLFLLAPFIFIPVITFVIKHDVFPLAGLACIACLILFLLQVVLLSILIVLCIIWLIPQNLFHLRGLILLGIFILCVVTSTAIWWWVPLTENIIPFLEEYFNPVRWCTGVLCYGIYGNYSSMVKPFTSVIGLTMALYGLTGLLYKNLYLKHYSYVRGKIYPYESKSPALSLPERFLTFPNQIRLKHVGALWLKEWRSIVRDRVIWFLFAPIIIISLAGICGSFFVTQEISYMPFMPTGAMLFLLSLFMGVSSFGREGQEIAQLSELPILGRTIIISKILFYTFLNSLFLMLISIPIKLEIMPYLMKEIQESSFLIILFLILFLGFWSSCLSVLPGIVFPKFNAKMSLRATSWPGSATFIMFLTLFWMSFFGVIFMLNWLGWTWIVYLVLLTLIWLGVVIFLYREALQRLEGLGRISRAI